MKKLLCPLGCVVLVAVLALAACGGSGGTTEAASSSTAPSVTPSLSSSAAASATASAAPGEPTNVGDLAPTTSEVGWGTSSVGKYAFTSDDPADDIHEGDRIVAHGTWYEHGVYAHAPSLLTYGLDGRFSTFSSTLAMVDSIKGKDVDGVVFVVGLDGAEVYRSEPMFIESKPRHIKLSVAGGQVLELVTEPRGDNSCDWAIWGDPVLR